MAKKNMLSVGFNFPGNFAEYIPPKDKRSLMDGDIVIVQPDISSIYQSDISSIFHFASSSYKGKPALSDHDSFEVRECVNHWKKEISDTLRAGKTVFIFLDEVQDVFVDSGERKYSGTGRNRQETKLVTPLNNYQMIPASLGLTNSKGKSMRLADNAVILSAYWKEFSYISQYRVYTDSKLTKRLVVSRDGSRTLGGLIRYESFAGIMVLLPYLDIDNNEEFTEEKEEKVLWSKKGIEFGRKLLSQLLEIDKTLRATSDRTPQPDWVKAPEYVLDKERTLQDSLLVLEQQIEKLQTKKDELKTQIKSESSLKRLLYEKGTQLEESIIDALSILGFKADRFQDSESEFDVVFESKEGRFIGEAEGKDNKSINIDKLRQLAMNIHEDLARESVNEPAKGVLFGNAFRLSSISEREDFFTPKCISAAERSGIALVRTTDLFLITKYLRSKNDKKFASQCRKAIFEAHGDIATFPEIPKEKEDIVTEKKIK